MTVEERILSYSINLKKRLIISFNKKIGTILNCFVCFVIMLTILPKLKSRAN